jgi:hypothetical protein
MKLPESVFSLLNPIVRALLRSPIHGFWSESLMLITFTGRKSGRVITTPVRYVRAGNNIRCFTSREIPWWRNLRGGAEVVLRVQGRDGHYNATVIENDPGLVREALVYYLGLYPQDAAYHDIQLNEDGSPFAEDLDRACANAIIVEASPMRD